LAVTCSTVISCYLSAPFHCSTWAATASRLDLYRLGYDERAFLAQTLVAAIVLPLSYFFGDPQRNINLGYGFGKRPQTRVPALWFLAFLTLMFPVAIYLPTHLVLDKIFGPASSG